MKLPWLPARALPAREFAAIRRRAIFECFKWDPQVEDVATLASFPLILEADAWATLARLAEDLARETASAEMELASKPRLHERLGLPRAVRRALRHAHERGHARGCARIVRFDFHFTTEGWRISEANSDVPGGLNEASGFARLMAQAHPGCAQAGDPAAAYAQALLAAAHAGAKIALVHATAYADDNQVMSYLARELELRGALVRTLSPAHIAWRAGRAEIDCDWDHGPVDVIARFFPAEWLPNLEARSGFEHFFGASSTPLSNPASALLTQSKRFPLVWDELDTDLSTWRALLPRACDPRAVEIDTSERGAWVVKPVLGRVGEGVGIPGVSSAAEWKEIARAVRRAPNAWVAQRRFEALPLETELGAFFPCIGVYTIDGRAAGAYGRLARRALIDMRAQDVAVLLAPAVQGGATASAGDRAPAMVLAKERA